MLALMPGRTRAADVFALAEATLSQRLVIPAAFQEILRITALLPTPRIAGLEMGLADRPGPAEPLLGFGRHDLAAQLLTVPPTDGGLPEFIGKRKWWQSIARLLGTVQTTNFGFIDVLDDFWLEFDSAEGNLNVDPCLFFGLRAERLGSPREYLPLLRCVRVVMGLPEPAGAQLQTLQHVFHVLEMVGYLYQVGWLDPRHEEAMRLCLSHLPGGALRELLVRDGWDWAGVENWILTLSQAADHVFYDLDVREGRIPKIGLEAHFSEVPQTAASARWRNLLDCMCQMGLCTSDVMHALLLWPGLEPIAAHMSSFSPLQAWFKERADLLLLRGLNHVKVSLSPGKPPNAKVYAWLTIKWRPHKHAYRSHRNG